MLNSKHILKVSRIESLTDGIFAIAMTILILNLSIPTDADVSDLSTLLLTDILLKLVIYIGSFIILGTLWIGMHFQIGLLERINRPYLWTHVFYLMGVCIVPFSSSLVAAHPNNIITISFYAGNLLYTSTMQLIICQFAYIYKLNSPICTPVIRSAIIKRIFLAPLFYIAALITAHWNPSAAFVLLAAPTIVYMLPGRVDRYDM
jgi:uncharacterized membrane protein